MGKLTLDDMIEMTWDWRAPVLMMRSHDAGVFDAAGREWKEADEIASALKASPRATRLLLTALAGAGLMEKSGTRFRNTDAAQRHLVRSSPEYRGHLLEMNSRAVANWLRIPQVLKTGSPIPRPERTKEEADAWQEVFIQAMRALSDGQADRMFEALPLFDGMRMLDIGCGPAAYMIHFAKKLPAFTAVAFDRPASERVVRSAAQKAGVADRVTFAGGDCLTYDFEGSYDGVLISQVLHIMSASQAGEVVRKAAGVSRPGGFVAIHEMTLGPDDDPGPSAIFAVQMMLGTKEGSVYTADEISGWLEDAGLEIESISRLNERSEMIVGRKPAARAED